MLQLRTVGGDAPEDFSLTDELLNRGMDYLRTKGAASCFAASRFPFSPFYTGLYGGSRVPGVPYEDADTISRLTRFGFETGERIAVFQCGVSAFRPPMNRQQLALRRQYQVNAIVDPRLSSWWDCCTYGHAEIMGFRLVRRCDQAVVASMILWEIQPLSTQWGRLTLGLIDLWVDQGERRRGLATLLVGETIRQVATQGVLCIEVQIRETNEPAIGFVRSLGFEQISFGIEMKKKLL
jgi:ribosomal protein S18 acetylase RimI-like enzyme